MADPVRVQREESFQTSGPPATLVVGYVNPDDLARAIREGAIPVVDERIRAILRGTLTALDRVIAAPREPAQERQEAPTPDARVLALIDGRLRELKDFFWQRDPQMARDLDAFLKGPIKLHFTNEWLRKKIATDPDDEPEAGAPFGLPPSFPAQAPAVEGWKCKARATVLPEPQDCNWPLCGCDPYADKVLAALDEAGMGQISAQSRDTPPTPTSDPLLPGLRAARQMLDLVDYSGMSRDDALATLRNNYTAEIARREGGQ